MSQLTNTDEQKAILQEKEYALPYHFFIAPPSWSASVGDQLHYVGAIECALEWLTPLDGISVLDAGCGEGRVAYELVRQGADVWGIDTSERAIAMAQVLVPEAKLSTGSLSDLRHFRDGSFHHVLMMEVLEHMTAEGRYTTLRELHRVLMPGGQLVISVPSNLVPLVEIHYMHFSVASLSDTLGGWFSLERVIGYHRKTIWYSLLARCCDNQFWTLTFPLREVYRRFVRLCPADKGVQLLAMCAKVVR